jgi:hypothetical protein
MPSVKKAIRLIHWRPDEAEPLIRLMQDGGYSVHYPGPRDGISMSSIRSIDPVAVVIDLSRMPSHGRYAAISIREIKSLSHIPIVFVGGDAAKVERIRAALPDALFTDRTKLVAVLKRVKPLKAPVVAQGPKTSYEVRTTVQKLGIPPGMRVAVVDPPAGLERMLGDLPEEVDFVEDEAAPLTLWFVRDPDAYRSGLNAMRARAAKSRLWVVYPKGKTSPLTQFTVREEAKAVGLVDYKICSVNDTWTAMLFTVKK